MGLTDFLGKRLRKNAEKRVRPVSEDSAQAMLATMMMSSTHSGDTSNAALCKAAIEGRPKWRVGPSVDVSYEGRNTGFYIDDNTEVLDFIGFVVRTEWENDPVIYNMPDPKSLIKFGEEVARSFVKNAGMG